MSAMRSNLVDISCELRAETNAAFLISDGGPKAEWVPKSQVEMEEQGFKGLYICTMPEWLAKEKGFL